MKKDKKKDKPANKTPELSKAKKAKNMVRRLPNS